MSIWKEKYIKYKKKYLDLQELLGGGGIKFPLKLPTKNIEVTVWYPAELEKKSKKGEAVVINFTDENLSDAQSRLIYLENAAETAALAEKDPVAKAKLKTEAINMTYDTFKQLKKNMAAVQTAAVQTAAVPTAAVPTEIFFDIGVTQIKLKIKKEAAEKALKALKKHAIYSSFQKQYESSPQIIQLFNNYITKIMQIISSDAHALDKYNSIIINPSDILQQAATAATSTAATSTAATSTTATAVRATNKVTTHPVATPPATHPATHPETHPATHPETSKNNQNSLGTDNGKER